jgi:hypothetical protein
VAIDARSASSYQIIEISDISEPEVSIGVSAILERTYGDDVVLSGQVSDNWGISTIEWLVDDVLMRTNSDSDEGATVFNHLFNSSYAAGLHSITLRATDNSGMVSEDSATINLYDSTPPVIGTHQEEVALQIGQTFRFEANVSDDESNNLLFSWDFDDNTDSDSDGDPRNDDDGFGDSVLWSYDTSGPMTVVCQVENDAGLVTEFEVLVNVLSGSEGEESDLMQLGIMAAGALVVIILISLVTWRFMSNRRLAAIIAEEEQSEQPATAPPSVEEQKAMWGGSEPIVQTEQPAQQVFGDFSSGMSGSTQGISAAMGEPDGEELDSDIAALLQSSRESSSSASEDTSNLLSEFEDEDDAVEREDIDFSHDSQSDETVSNWSPGEADTEISHPEESEPEPDRTVRQNCSSCDKKFEVELPPGIDTARTACPHCSSIESVSLE